MAMKNMIYTYYADDHSGAPIISIISIILDDTVDYPTIHGINLEGIIINLAHAGDCVCKKKAKRCLPPGPFCQRLASQGEEVRRKKHFICETTGGYRTWDFLVYS